MSTSGILKPRVSKFSPHLSVRLKDIAEKQVIANLKLNSSFVMDVEKQRKDSQQGKLTFTGLSHDLEGIVKSQQLNIINLPLVDV